MKPLLYSIFCTFSILLLFYSESYGQYLSHCEQIPVGSDFFMEEESLCTKFDRIRCTINISNTNSSVLGIGGYSNQIICISGVFTINTNFLFMGCTIKCAPGSQIIVEAGNKFTVYYSFLFACEEMWKGIQVKENAEIDMYQSEIEDAQYAVDLIKPASVSIKHNTFNRNYIGIEFKQSGVIPSVPYIVKGNRFFCTSPLNAAYSGQTPAPNSRSFCGVRSISHPALTIDGYFDSFYSSFIENKFDLLRNGIITISSNITIQHSSFTNIIDEGSHEIFQTGIGIYGIYWSRIKHYGLGTFDDLIPTFNNCQRAGIYTNASLLSTEQSLYTNIGLYGVNCTNQYFLGATISSNRFIDAGSSTLSNIYLEKGLSESIINTNTIIQTNYYSGKIEVKNLNGYSSMVTIRNNFIDIKASYGIEISSDIGDGFLIANNYVNGQSDNNLGFGILSWNNSGSNYRIESNHCFGGHYSGIQGVQSQNTLFCDNRLYNNEIGLALKDSHAGSVLSENKFYGTNNFGLNMQNSIMLGDQRHKGNTWSGTFSSLAAYYNSGTTSDSQFFVNSLTSNGSCYNPQFLPNNGGTPSVNPASGWYFQQSTDTCQFCVTPPLPKESNSEWMEAIAIDGGIEAFSYSVGAAWDAEYYLYRQVMDDPETYSEPFYTTAVERISQNSLIPAWYEVNTLFRVAADGPSGLIESLIETESAIQDILHQLGNIETAYHESGDLPDNWETLSLALEYYLDQSTSMGENYNQWREEQWQTIEATLNTLQPITPMDLAMLEYMYIRLYLMQHPESFFDMLQSVTSLVQKCYDQNGAAPKMAISFLPSCMQEAYLIDEQECNETHKPDLNYTTSIASAITRVRLIPNPASHEVQILSHLAEDISVFEMNIYNQLGKLVHNCQVKDMERINIDQLPSGTYIARFISSDGKECDSVKFQKI